ncbi:uncharacterized protein CTRU02_206780 [Colletotrichum truncatum]|uniref:Uncharacterized protein n=1 Tax=Colletotrichum truncatum TaxID=5467 RepID=A0ACC3Z824_COLTU|nr:uncharacterized protein CTRU02_14202 [Colletotrichum truncatum]KAF6782555.1 hypothetical protein CTRU02_14202 [Colletotrichum truncatum]
MCPNERPWSQSEEDQPPMDENTNEADTFDDPTESEIAADTAEQDAFNAFVNTIAELLSLGFSDQQIMRVFAESLENAKEIRNDEDEDDSGSVSL